VHSAHACLYDQHLFGCSTVSEAFFRVDVSRVRRSASRQLPISTEAAPPLSPAVFFLAVSQALSKSMRADCKKA